ncbi:MAG: VCBS repeat-containing protein [Halieaceae bacterium]|jgi:hypothetical protein|nr:VCBS repeat-containing protein [Halieaceae bacterium]
MIALSLHAACAGGSALSSESASSDTLAIPRFQPAILLEEEATTSANASVGDLDGDGHLDVLLIRGRHWPVTNRILFGDGQGGFPRSAILGSAADRSYTGALADLDGDGDLDVVVSNDRPDPKRVFLNERGVFRESSNFGDTGWKTRNISLADVNADTHVDIVVANRGPRGGPSPNYLCLNDGAGRFPACESFSPESATTISAEDLNGDGRIDLVVPHRDGGQSRLYLSCGGADLSFRAQPFGPSDAAIRATAVADVDADGRPDLVAIYTGRSEGGDGERRGEARRQGAFIHYGEAALEFAPAVALDARPRAPYALLLADLNADGRVDILIGHVDAGSVLYVNRGGRSFLPVELGDSDGTAYGFAVGDLNEDGCTDIVIAKSGAQNRLLLADCRYGE